ncbi:hypothetical protein K4K56_012237 [Colletotrichum sp. SAR 10_98]|nr:hypothetical protein K4K56_012237 [Colletotrichum sp. SAR 10_98]
MWSPAIIFAIFTTHSAATDCAFYWSYPSGVYDKRALGRIDKAVGICATEIGGHVLVPDMDVQNGDNKANQCTVCRGARSGTEDFMLDYFTTQCGSFGDGCVLPDEETVFGELGTELYGDSALTMLQHE